MDFDIDGIATIAWSGFAKQLGDESTVKPGFVDPKQQTVTGASGDGDDATITVASTTDFRVGQRIYVEGMDPAGYDTADIGSLKNPAGALITALTPTTISYASTGTGFVSGGTVGSLKAADQTPAVISTGLTTTTNFIRNRISKVTLRNETGGLTDDYNLVLTGGNFTLENNINYLTPEELGVVNAPLANITGARSISGSMTCYLDNDTVGEKSGKLFSDLVSDTTTIRNVFNMQLQMGGDTGGTPRVYLDMPTAHLEVPTINVEDLLTLEINFHGQVSNGNVDNTDEATIIYNS
jgi:hypothetical protein